MAHAESGEALPELVGEAGSFFVLLKGSESFNFFFWELRFGLWFEDMTKLSKR